VEVSGSSCHVRRARRLHWHDSPMGVEGVLVTGLHCEQSLDFA
jgi:hypothetical protein